MRVVRADGEPVAVQLGEWYPHWDADVAVTSLGVADKSPPMHFVPDSSFLTRRDLELHVGPGDDTFYVGRFRTHEGRTRPTPTVRFGNIAMMPGEPISSAEVGQQESFLVEMRSLSGYSGSPVFVYSGTVEVDVDAEDPEFSTVRYEPLDEIKLLGVDWCHLRDFAPVVDAEGLQHPDAWRVQDNTGMMGVIPAWKLQELLNDDDVAAKRRSDQQGMSQSHAHLDWQPARLTLAKRRGGSVAALLDEDG